MTLDDLLKAAVDMGATALHVKADSPPLVRRHGEMVALEVPPLTPEQAQGLSYAGLTEEQKAHFQAAYELEFRYAIPDYARFHGRIYRQRGHVQSVFRVLPLYIRTLEELRLPPVCRYFAERPRGLVLVSGPAGSGKSTTLAAMVDYINRHFPLHIITAEDPVEFIHHGQQAVINQREVERDTLSVESALKSALRQDADVMVVGELRNAETISLALSAAETGHLVFGTMCMSGAIGTIDRLIDLMPSQQQASTRMRLAVNLIGVVSQTLVKTADGKGRVAAFETLVGVPAVRTLIRETKTSQIHALMQVGLKQGMMAQDQSLSSLVKKCLVTYEAALEHAHNVTEFHFLCTEGQTGADAAAHSSGAPLSL